MLCDKFCQRLATGRWFFSGTRVSATSKTDCHDITEILLKVELYTITLTLILRFDYFQQYYNYQVVVCFISEGKKSRYPYLSYH